MVSETRKERRLKNMHPGTEWVLLRANEYDFETVAIYRSQYALNKWVVVVGDSLGNKKSEQFDDDISAWRTYYSRSMATLINESHMWFEEASNDV